MTKPTLCVDFDGVLHSYKSGWKGADVVADEPVPGAFEWLLKALETFDVQIYSSRSSQEGGVAAMFLWFERWAVVEFLGDVSKITTLMQGLKFPVDKPKPFLTIDDRAICFEGDWSRLDPKELIRFKPWNKR